MQADQIVLLVPLFHHKILLPRVVVVVLGGVELSRVEVLGGDG